MATNLVAWKAEFDRCWPWLWESLCAFGCPTHTKEQVWQRILTGKAFMWPGESSCIVVELIDYPIGWRACNYWLQGGDLKDLKTKHAAIEDWAQQAGCVQAKGGGREGWSRAMAGEWRKGPTTRIKWLGEPPAVVRRALHDPGRVEAPIDHLPVQR